MHGKTSDFCRWLRMLSGLEKVGFGDAFRQKFLHRKSSRSILICNIDHAFMMKSTTS